MFKHYLTTALRNFRRSPYVTAINVFGLALGLACFISAYSAVTYLRSGDRHFVNADRIYAIAQRQTSAQSDLDTGMRPVTAPMVAKYIRADFPELEAVVRATRMPPIATAVDGRATFVRAAATEADFLRMFDFQFVAGGGMDALRSPRSAVLTKDTAVRLFGTHNAVGRTMLLSDAVGVTVTGVIEEPRQPSHMGQSAISAFGFEMLLSWDVYRELSQRRSGRDPESIPEVEAWGWTAHLTYVMLPKDGSLSRDSFNDRLRTFSTRYVPPERAKSQKYEFRAFSLSELWISALDGSRRGRGLSAVAQMTLLSVLILFTACVNYANLATAQMATRAREIGLRKVTGAKGRSIVAQFLLEVALCAASALLIALLFVIALAPMMHSISGIDFIEPLQREFRLWGLIATVLTVVILTAGSYPAIVASRLRPAQAIRGGRIAGTPAFVPKLLVGIQFGATSLLLIAAIVVHAQHRDMRERALGESGDPIVAIHNNLAASNITFQTLQTELLRSPHIESVAAIDVQPWSGVNTFALTRTQDAAEQVVPPLLYAVTNDFFSTFDVPLLAGRTFDVDLADDVFPGTMPGAMAGLGGEKTYNVVIDRRLAAQLGWSNPQDAVNQRIYFPLSRIGKTDQPVRIAGVVEHKPLSLTTPDANANLFYFLPDAAGFQEVMVRISPTHASEALTDIDATWTKLSPNIPLTRQFVDEVFEKHYATFSRVNVMVGVLTALALTISTLGLFGMALFVATRRRHEIGLRKTIGARTSQIIVLLLRDFSKPVVIANLVVWPLAYIAMQTYLSVFVHRISLTPLPFVGSLLISLCIAWLAVGGQTIRAARMNPATVLRYE
jgi:putative ABC transport system permease protein